MGGRDRPEPPEVLTDPKRPRIVVVGAGFSGLWAVRVFYRRAVRLILPDACRDTRSEGPPLAG